MRRLAALALALSGCASPAPAEDELVVFAAASLREAFGALAADFERAHPGVEVTLAFAGTQELRVQLEQGAAADVFASADPRHMETLARAGLVEAPRTFARNEPVIVARREAGVTSLEGLAAADRIVLGTREVPIGRYAEEALARAGPAARAAVDAKVVSREPNVRQVLAKVRLGEADAGIVYRTDARAAPELAVVELPAGGVVAEYPIAAVRGAAHPALAAAFIAHVRSDAGRRVLEDAGFRAPAGP